MRVAATDAVIDDVASVVMGFVAVGFVVGVNVIAEIFAGGIEDDGNTGVGMIAEYLQEHIAEP